MSKLIRRRHAILKVVLGAVLALLVLPNLGCIGFTSQLLYFIKGGHKLPAEFDGLSGKRVAVVCVSDSSAYGPDTFAGMLERNVAAILRQKGDEIDVIHSDDVADWIDNNEWDQLDYREIGRGVGADAVLAIDVKGLSLHEGKTLYKGRADMTLTVYDISDDGRIAFRTEIPELAFPKNGPRHATEISEARFRRLFVHVAAENAAKYFYDYHIEDDFARDAILLGG
jgi:hypothetical protein